MYRTTALDTTALEDDVLAAVPTGMTTVALATALRDPARRTRARAELARRITSTSAVDTCPGCDEPMTDDDSRVFDSVRVSGRWHDTCGEDAKS